MNLGFESSEADDDFIENEFDVDLPPHERQLAIASERLSRCNSRAHLWAVENPAHPASYLMVREDLDDQSRVRALRRIESIALPEVIQALLDAEQNLHECQAEAEVIRQAELAVSTADSEEGSDDETGALLHLAYLELLSGYRNWGGFRYHGSERPPTKWDYPGPMIWSDQDTIFRTAKALEGHFPGRVRLDHKISDGQLNSSSKGASRSHRLGLVVAKPGLFAEDLRRREFRALDHEIFAGVSWLRKSNWTKSRRTSKRCEEIQLELDLLQNSLDSELCRFAAMFIFDDEGFLDFHGDLLRWPKDVIPLVVSPSSIQTERLGNGSINPFLIENEKTHDLHCDLCR